MKTFFDFGFRSYLHEENQCFFKIGARLFKRIALACNVQLWAERDESVTFSLDYSGHMLDSLHGGLFRWDNHKCTDTVNRLWPRTALRKSPYRVSGASKRDALTCSYGVSSWRHAGGAG